MMKNLDSASASATLVCNFFATISYLSINRTLPLQAARRKIILLSKVLLLLIFLLKIDMVKGQDHLDGINKVVGTGYDQYGVYIDFAFTYWDDDNYNSWLNYGILYCTPESGSEFRVAQLVSKYQPFGNCDPGEGDKDHYPIDIITYDEGTIVAKCWGGSDHPSKSEYPTQRSFFTPGYTPGSNGWYVIFSGSETLPGDDVDNTSRVYLRWYLPYKYLGQRLTFRYYWNATIDCSDSRNGDYPGFGTSSYTTITPLSTLNVQDPTFSHVAGNFAVSYNFSGKNQYATKISFAGENQYKNAGEAPSGTFNILFKNNTSRKIGLVAKARLQPIPGTSSYVTQYEREKKITIPAYTWPGKLKATYNDTNTVTLSWQIPKPSGDHYISGDNFEIQRSTDSAFQKNVKTIATMAYDNDKTNYSASDELSDIKGGTEVYYRLRRTKSKSQWGWDITRKTNIAVKIDTVLLADTVRQGSKSKPEAIITWEPFYGVWLNETKFSLIRSNLTTGEKNTIALSEEQARSGKYIDKNIIYCKKYTYSIQLALGNGYLATAEKQVPGSILVSDIGTISQLTTSKGYFPDRVDLHWQTEGGFDNYIVKRKVYGSSDNYIQVATVPNTASDEAGSSDSKAAPGVYYQYRIMGAVGCADTVKYSDTLQAIGFRSPTGNIYGRVTYENGQAVKNVAVRLQNNDSTQMGQSIYLNGKDSSYLKLDSLHTPFVDSALTIEAWIRPDGTTPKDQVIFSRGGQYELGFDAGGRLYFTYNGTTVKGDYFNKNQIYVHIAGIHTRDSLLLMINDSLIAKTACAPSVSHPDKTIYIGRNTTGHNFKGYIDEMSVWNIALTPQWIAKNYTRFLTGGEKGLLAYWRFDETITNQFYDLSHAGTKYHRNDGVMNPRHVKRSGLIPDKAQLSLKAYTDSTGNYMISGVPYSGQGTTYTIVPLFGTHQFDPVSVNRLISASSPTFTVDFTDQSSFSVTGIVYYFNSTIPVPDVQFLIDGKYAQKSDGQLIQTGADGKFSISVPVGTHEVKAVKSNHVFMNGGKITDRFGHDRNYQKPEGPFILYDSTSIRFIGRVAGGAVQEAYPLGHSLSTNNLGKILTITLKLPSDKKYDLYKGNKADSTVYVDHLLPSNQTDSSKIHKTRVVYEKNEIIIYPDSLTGEFAVDLIPVKFIVASVTATGWGDLLDNGPVSLDLTNKFIDQYSVYSYEDSSQTNEGNWNYTQYNDSVTYNYSYQFIMRVTPSVSIVQVNNSKEEMTFFGDSIYTYHTLGGGKQDIAIIDHGKTGREQYLMGYPVFTQSKPYHFKIKAYEEYPFYVKVKPDNTPVMAAKDGKPVIDKVPTADGLVSINNSLRNGTTQADTLSLDSTGTGYYDFVAGGPEIAYPGTKDFAASIQFGQATNVSWKWLGTRDKMSAFVMGTRLTGTDFVTAGPNKILMVLRDPPGNKSYSYVQEGSTVSNSSTYTGTVDQVGDIETVATVGAKIITWVGVGAGTINVVNAKTIADITVHHEEHYTGSNTKSSRTTFTTRFQTSSDPAFVGAPGDLYVGYSTNITYGMSNNLILIKRDDLKAADSVIYESSSTSPYLVVSREGINFGQKFGTLFAYPQQHIVKVLIPNLINIRNSLLLPSSTSPTEAQQKANNSKMAVYVSKLTPDNKNFGKSNDDIVAFGQKAKTDPVGDGESYKIYYPQSTDYRTDTIMILNQYIHGWQQEIAHNEEEKINSRSNLIQNYSFHSGSPVDYSASKTYSNSATNSFNIILSAKTVNSASTKILGAGLEFKFTESLGTQQGGSFSTGAESTTNMGFELASSGTDEYLSVNLNAVEKPKLPGLSPSLFGGFTFQTKGGQTSCPYEGVDTTLYYKPTGTLLNQPTVQIEVPRIKVDNPIANNVPSTQAASYTLYLSNESEAHLPVTFVLSYANTDSVKGAFIAVDGSTIASGRAFSVQYGQTIKKVLTLKKGPKAMDYNNIPIILHSACQYDLTGYLDLIADTVLISAHFVPSCSNVNIKSPPDQFILNTLSQTNQQGKRYIPITLNDFDMSDNLFDHIELQYKPSANSQWITAMKFYGDSSKYKAAQGEKAFITNPQGINYNLVMNDAAFNDQKYDIRALAVCKLGPGNFINTPSDVITGIKDTYNPRLFGTPEPGNGILGIGDDIRLNFNEPVAAGLLTTADFKVTGIRNGAQSDHSVSVSLDGQNDFIKTEFDKNLTGKDITAEMWVLPDKKEDGTVFSQGNINESMELGFTADNHLEVIIGSKVIKSDKPLDYKAGEWAHVALVYHAEDSTVSAFYNFQAVIHNVSVPRYEGQGPIEFGRSISRQGNFFAGKMHGARIWTQPLTATTLQVNSLTRLSGAEDGLLAYYPMTEGKGTTIFDKAHGNNATLTGSWSTPPGKAIAFNGEGYIKMATGTAPVTSAMDYTISLWFKAKPGQSDATLVSNGKGDGTDPGPLASKNLFFLGFENGLITFENNGFKVQADGNYLDDQWHHVAIAVNRVAGTARLFVDGELKKYFNTKNLGGIAAAYTYLGARVYFTDQDVVTPHFDRYFKGEIDEFRIWNTYLDQAFINMNSNVRLKGDELGLMAYYPFEKYYTFQGQKEMGFTLADQKIQEDPNLHIPDAVALNATESDNMAPIKDRGPVNNLNFDFVVNNDALIINLLEPKQAIDQTIVTLQAKDVKDLHGNSLVSPITWTAYIDQNPLKWSDEELNLSKELYAPMQFESYVVNSSGNIQHFTLDNLPAWLTADPSEGNVAPEGKQKVTFTINKGLNVGTYNEIVFMRNDNGETASLPVNVKVKGQVPDWKVNPADFQYNMTVYGKIRIDHIFSNDPEDILAAFIHGKCVGLTHNTYFSKQDLWYAFLLVYSDSIQEDDLEFRIWDASTGKIYEGIPSEPVSFVRNSVAGNPDAPVIFDGKEMLFRNIELNKGWNWLSFNLVNNNLKDINTSLANGDWMSGDIIKHDERGFDQYSVNNGWVGTLAGFDNLSLFKLKTGKAQTLSVSGTLPDMENTPITVKGNRWNYISYLPQVNMTLEEALADYKASSGDEIKSQTGFSMYSTTKGWIGNLTYLEPGKGYMLYRKAGTNTEFTYPTISGSLTIHRLAGNNGSIERLNPYQNPVAGNFYFADNMTVIARADKEFKLQTDDKILAYVGNDLRGKAQAVNNPLINNPSFFFNISGKQQQPVYFSIERNGKVVARTKPVVSYFSNNRIGSLKEPFMLHFEKINKENGDNEVTLYPNPFNDHVNIYVSLKTASTHDIQISVWNVAGQLIFKASKKQVNNGYYHTVWNGKTTDGTDCTPGIYFIHIFVDDKPYVYKVIKY